MIQKEFWVTLSLFLFIHTSDGDSFQLSDSRKGKNILTHLLHSGIPAGQHTYVRRFFCNKSWLHPSFVWKRTGQDSGGKRYTMEKEEFKRIWMPLRNEFYGTAFSILRSEQDAMDAVQDLYIRLWNIRDRTGGLISPLAYGLTAIRRICLDRLRTSAVRRQAGNIDDFLDSIDSGVFAADCRDAEKELIGRETVESLEKALGELPENCRKVARMRFFRQMEYAEIMEKTGYSYINVRVLVNRARKRLSEALYHGNSK